MTLAGRIRRLEKVLRTQRPSTPPSVRPLELGGAGEKLQPNPYLVHQLRDDVICVLSDPLTLVDQRPRWVPGRHRQGLRRTAFVMSCNDIVDDVSVDVGEAEVAAAKSVHKFRMVQAK